MAISRKKKNDKQQKYKVVRDNAMVGAVVTRSIKAMIAPFRDSVVTGSCNRKIMFAGLYCTTSNS